MTLSNSQYIEVAEKVWGLTPETLKKDIVTIGKAGDAVWRDMNDGSPYGGMWQLHEIINKINSWQGFGRTLEAMAEKDMYPYINEDWDILFFHKNDLGAAHRPRFTYSNSDIKTLIEATHLAALEALK